jgi:hypothetical protein
MKAKVQLGWFAVFLGVSGSVLAYDYPTSDRVQFVEECVRDYPDRGHFEMVAKCSCLVDQLAKKYDYDQFVDLTTAAKAFSISGERGNVVRDSDIGKSLNAEYKKAAQEGKEACFIR